MVHRKQANRENGRVEVGRRKFIATAGSASIVALAGCTDEPAVERSGTVTLPPGEYHAEVFEVSDDPGANSFDFSVIGRGDDTKFGVYVFEAGQNSEYETYKDLVAGDGETEEPSAIRLLTEGRIDGTHESSGLSINPGEYTFVIDNTRYEGWKSHGYPPTDSELEVEFEFTVNFTAPGWVPANLQ